MDKSDLVKKKKKKWITHTTGYISHHLYLYHYLSAMSYSYNRITAPYNSLNTLTNVKQRRHYNFSSEIINMEIAILIERNTPLRMIQNSVIKIIWNYPKNKQRNWWSIWIMNWKHEDQLTNNGNIFPIKLRTHEILNTSTKIFDNECWLNRQ